MFRNLREIYEKVRSLLHLPSPKTLRAWRMVDLGEDVGMYCFFDPLKEKIFIYPLTDHEAPGILESMVSVSDLETGTGVAPHQINLFSKGMNHAKT